MMCPNGNMNLRHNHHTGAYIPYSLLAVCRFFNVPYNLLYCKIPKISPSKYKAPNPVTQKTLR